MRAKLSVRVAPGPAGAARSSRRSGRHLLAQPAWGARVEVTLKETGEAFAADADGPAYDAARGGLRRRLGRRSRSTSASAARSRSSPSSPSSFPDAAILVTGVEDPDTRAHGIDESLHLGEFERVCVAEAVLLERLAALPR